MKIHDCSKLRVCLSFSFPEYIFSLGRLFKSGEYIEKKINKYIEQCENHSGWFSEFFCEGGGGGCYCFVRLFVSRVLSSDSPIGIGY